MDLFTDPHVADVRQRIAQQIDFAAVHTDEAFLHAIERIVSTVARTCGWTASERVRVVTHMVDHFRGYDVIGPLLADDTVTEVMVNGPSDIFFERAGLLHRFKASFESQERLEHLIVRIVSKVNRTINEAHPLVDARLPDGSRVHAVFPPIALRGPVLTIRKFPATPFTMDMLIHNRTVSQEAAHVLAKLVQAKFNLFISGGTGSGKTTLLNVLAQCIPQTERVITIEDAAELQLQLPNVVVMETRPPNTEGKGALTMRQLIRAALRMRPDRIVVGEVRGEEALDMMQAMNTGHEGSLSTGHANSIPDMLRRLETMMLLASDLPLTAIRQHIASALHVVVHVSRTTQHARKVTAISEVVGGDASGYVLNPLYVWDGTSITATGNPMHRAAKWEEMHG
ncbi:MAG: CpaF family protein [Paenibacillaceae bacterium]|nr:CpaF family protein [Paenibacillaceae bacterium]